MGLLPRASSVHGTSKSWLTLIINTIPCLAALGEEETGEGVTIAVGEVEEQQGWGDSPMEKSHPLLPSCSQEA